MKPGRYNGPMSETRAPHIQLLPDLLRLTLQLLILLIDGLNIHAEASGLFKDFYCTAAPAVCGSMDVTVATIHSSASISLSCSSCLACPRPSKA